MSTEMQLFNKHTQPPVWALKEIQAGRLKGKSDINPQWRIFALTDMFGLCGFGWKYQIDKIEYKQAENKEIAVFAHISLFVKKDDIWSDAIIGTGGSMFVTNEKNGAYTSDEAEKMAITDAISVACKLIGIAGNVYSGSKYLGTIPQTKAPEIPQMTEEQKTKIISFSLMTSCFNEEKIKGILEWITKPQTQENAQRFINRLEATVQELMNAEKQ